VSQSSNVVDPSSALQGERMLSVSPGTAQEAARTWLRHPHFFAGRALTTASLEVRQRWQEGRVVSRGQGLLAGVDEGLEVTIEQHVVRRPMEEAPQIEEWVRVDPGRALCADGDDVVLTQAISCPMEMLPVLDSGSAQQTALLPLGDWLSSRESSTTAVGILVLQPIRIDIGEFDRSILPIEPSGVKQVSWSRVRSKTGTALMRPDLSGASGLRASLSCPQWIGPFFAMRWPGPSSAQKLRWLPASNLHGKAWVCRWRWCVWPRTVA
jgi:hypothetical protein